LVLEASYIVHLSGQTINQDYFKGLYFWRKLAGKTAGKGWLVYGGDS